MKLTKEELIKAYKANVLDKEGLRDLIEWLLNPSREELETQLKDILTEDNSCIFLQCSDRQRMKGHIVSCKNQECMGRIPGKGNI